TLKFDELHVDPVLGIEVLLLCHPEEATVGGAGEDPETQRLGAFRHIALGVTALGVLAVVGDRRCLIGVRAASCKHQRGHGYEGSWCTATAHGGPPEDAILKYVS